MLYKSLFMIVLFLATATSSLAQTQNGLNLAELFKDKKVKIEGDNLAMMNFLSYRLSQMKVTHFSVDSVVQSLKEQARTQTGLTETSNLQIGNQLVGDYTIGVVGKNPVILKIINNQTAELQTAQYTSDEDFKKAFVSNNDSSSTKVNIRCQVLIAAFKKDRFVKSVLTH